MSKKEIKLHMGFLDENGCMIEIPDNIQKLINAREEYWFNKMKDIDNACGKLLKKLDKQWLQIQADANHIEYLEKENKRLSKNLKLSRKQKEKYYNSLLVEKLEKIKNSFLLEQERVEENYSKSFHSPFTCCITFVRELINKEIEKLEELNNGK